MIRDYTFGDDVPSQILNHTKSRYPVADAISYSQISFPFSGIIHARAVAENDGNYTYDGWSFSYGIYESELQGDSNDNLLVLEGHSSNKTKTRAAEGYPLWAAGRGIGRSKINLGAGDDTALIYATGKGNFLNYANGIDDNSNLEFGDGNDSLSILLHAEGDEQYLTGIANSSISLGSGNDFLVISGIKEVTTIHLRLF